MYVGLIGNPVAHSASPRMQKAAFDAARLSDWRYDLWPTQLQDLPMRIRMIRDDADCAGCNITIPHKQAVIPLIDVLSSDAEALGAVNTIFKHDGQLIGDNTDWRGFLADLDFHGVTLPDNARAIVLGAGGSARAIAYALLVRNVPVTLINRNVERAIALAHDLARRGYIATAAEITPQTRATLIVNCTAAGMEPNDLTTPWPKDLPFPADAVLYDLVYKPRVTTLMRQAQASGARVIGGIGMLAEQGAAAFSLWTGINAANVTGVMRAALG